MDVGFLINFIVEFLAKLGELIEKLLFFNVNLDFLGINTTFVNVVFAIGIPTLVIILIVRAIRG